MNQAPGDFGDVTKAATIKHAVSEMFKLNFLPAKVLFSCLAPYFTAHFVITPLIFYALFGQVRVLERLRACVGGVLQRGAFVGAAPSAGGAPGGVHQRHLANRLRGP